MQTLLNGLILNEALNSLLLLIVIVLLINAFIDQRSEKSKQSNDFTFFLLFLGLYIANLLIYLPVKEGSDDELLIFVISWIRVCLGMMAYYYIGSWMICIVSKKQEINQLIEFTMKKGVFVIALISLILYVLTSQSLIANIPIIFYYCLLEAFVIIYRNALGKSYMWIITLFNIPTLLLQAQEWWNYTPANIYIVVFALVIYSRLWIVQKEKYLENERLLALKQAELENIRTKLVLSQIKPHFIYNTLGTITYLCGTEPDKAQEMSLYFAEYLRGNLSGIDSGTLIPFLKELEHVKTYLKIESMRFKDELKVEYDISATDFKMPALTVEPIVENAVKHGIRKKEDSGTVIIKTYETNEYNFVEIIDDGIGFETAGIEWSESEHVGMYSVRKRMENLCGGRMDIESCPGKGTKVKLYFPKTDNYLRMQSD